MPKEKKVRPGQQQRLSQPKNKPKKQKSGFDELIIVVGDGKGGSKLTTEEKMRIQKKGGGMSRRGLGKAFKNGGRS